MSPKANLTWMCKILAVCMFFLLLAGCQAAAVETPAPTVAATETSKPTEPPTDTPLPPPTDTPTPLPTDTPAPTDTPTPDLAATAALIATQTAEALLADITKELERVGVVAGEGSLGWIMSEPVTIKVDTYDTTLFSEFEPAFNAANYVIHTDITWESTGGLAVCGIMMRSEADLENGEQYVFQTIRLSGAPRWDIERWNYGDWVATASGQVMSSKTLDQTNGATNTVTIVAKEGVFTVFVNDDKSKNVLDSKLKEGNFAFMSWQDTGETTCTFNNAWVWVLP